MNQGTLINIRAMASTRAVKAAQRAREKAGLRGARRASEVSLGVVSVAAPASSPTRLPERSPAPRTDQFVGQCDLSLVGEDRKFFSPAGLRRCPQCALYPMMEVRWDRNAHRGVYGREFRIVCTVLCGRPPGPWHASNRDAIHCWNLAIILSR